MNDDDNICKNSSSENMTMTNLLAGVAAALVRLASADLAEVLDILCQFCVNLLEHKLIKVGSRSFRS